MIEEDEQNIVVLRKRRRNGSNGNGHGHGHNDNGHGAANGHSSARQEWGWTRAKNPFTDPPDREPRAQPKEEEIHPRRRISNGAPRKEDVPPDTVKLPFDPWRLVSAVRRRWSWLLTGAVLLGGLAFGVGNKLLHYKVSVNLIRREVSNAINPNEQDPNRPRQLSDQTLYSFMRSGEVLRRVAARAATNNPPAQTTVKELSKAVGIFPTANPDIITLFVSGSNDGERLATLANIFADEVVRYTREMQASESGDVASYLQQKVALVEKDLNAASEELARFQKGAGFSNLEKDTERYLTQISAYEIKFETARIEREMLQRSIVGLDNELKKQTPKDDRLRVAQEEYENLKLNYQPAHPLMIAAQRKIDLIKQQQGSSAGTNGSVGISMMVNSFANTLYMQKLDYEAKAGGLEKQIEEYGELMKQARLKMEGLSDKGQEYGSLKARVQSLEATRLLLVNRQRDSQLYQENAMGYFRVIGHASARDVDWKKRFMKICAMSAVGAGMGLLLGMLFAFFCEASDTRLKTVADIERTTGLPVLATVGDLKEMTPDDQVNWAFRTLTILRGKLCATPDDALVCGIISSRHGEGRSTWVNLLVNAASQRGLRVLTVDTRPTAEGPSTEPRPPQYSTVSRAAAPKTERVQTEAEIRETAVANDLLAKPMAVAERLKDPEAIVHIPIPGWVWSLDRRQQWQEALSQWREIDNTVILIELPPASNPEAILLAEKIPQLIWLVGSGMADVKETREQLETLRHAHCNIVGAVLNRMPKPPLNTRIGRWFNWATTMILLGFGLCVSTFAQDQKLAFSGTAQIKRAAWQEKLTLGPGDVMDIALYGHPDLARTNLFIGPDGRISYLQAQAIMAKGLSIEELRSRLDAELAPYYPSPRTIVVPTAFNSKKYYVLGKVVNKGVFPLDRPMTVIEAVARAQGLETGLYDRHTVEMADLSRSFLIRDGKKQQVNFEKLFLEGDLSQNIAIEPDDFLFFGASAVGEVYVLGHVLMPGAVGFVQTPTVITVITDRGGFTEHAYKGKVLVVRGSLNKPETYIINTKEILDGARPDFKLEPRDIVYVSQHPWTRAEELLDEATQSFIQGFVTAFSGVKIGPFIKNPVFGN